jgi:hypothetical protein
MIIPAINYAFSEKSNPGIFATFRKFTDRTLPALRVPRLASRYEITYSHAAETLFALVCAALQAPHYPIGWLLKYRYDDIKKLLTKIRERVPFDNLLGVDTGGWPAVVNALLP